MERSRHIRVGCVIVVYADTGLEGLEILCAKNRCHLWSDMVSGTGASAGDNSANYGCTCVKPLRSCTSFFCVKGCPDHSRLIILFHKHVAQTFVNSELLCKAHFSV